MSGVDQQLAPGIAPEASPEPAPYEPRERPLRRARISPVIAGVLVAALTIGVALGVGQGVNAIVGVPAQSGSPGLATEPYAFEFTQPGSAAPVTYDRCRAIRVVVNPEGAPEGYADVLGEALEEVSGASGFTFDLIGETDDTSFDRRVAVATPGHPVDPVLIGWASAEEVARLAGDVVGSAGSVAVRRRDGSLELTTGAIALDRTTFADLADSDEGHAEAVAILEHELGHLLGLAHVADPDELMYPRLVGQRGFGTGDRSGLARLGSAPCA